MKAIWCVKFWNMTKSGGGQLELASTLQILVGLVPGGVNHGGQGGRIRRLLHAKSALQNVMKISARWPYLIHTHEFAQPHINTHILINNWRWDEHQCCRWLCLDRSSGKWWRYGVVIRYSASINQCVNLPADRRLTDSFLTDLPPNLSAECHLYIDGSLVRQSTMQGSRIRTACTAAVLDDSTQLGWASTTSTQRRTGSDGCWQWRQRSHGNQHSVHLHQWLACLRHITSRCERRGANVG